MEIREGTAKCIELWVALVLRMAKIQGALFDAHPCTGEHVNLQISCTQQRDGDLLRVYAPDHLVEKTVLPRLEHGLFRNLNPKQAIFVGLNRSDGFDVVRKKGFDNGTLERFSDLIRDDPGAEVKLLRNGWRSNEGHKKKCDPEEKGSALPQAVR